MKKLNVVLVEIRIDLYDNGQIDGDTISVYHNNVLIIQKARLNQKPITFRIRVNKDQSYHELVMVAKNLGSIPPNTSVMIVTDGNRKQELFISSTEQNYAKVIL